MAMLPLILLFPGASLLDGEQVRTWEEKLSFPTYSIGKPDPTPLFDTGRIYQQAHALVYQYFWMRI